MAVNRDQIILSYRIQEEFKELHKLLTDDIRNISYNPKKRVYEAAPSCLRNIDREDLEKFSDDAEAIQNALIRFDILSAKNAKQSIVASCAFEYTTHHRLSASKGQKVITKNIPSILREAQENGWGIAAENVTLAVKMPVTEDTLERLIAGVVAIKAEKKTIEHLAQANVELWSMAMKDHIGVVERALQRAPQLEEAMMQIAKKRLSAQKTSQPT